MVDIFKDDGIHYCKRKTGRRLCPSSIDEINNKISITKVVNTLGFHITGKNKSIICPFHTEFTASCNIVEEKGHFFCKGCGTQGSIITFVQEYLRRDFIKSAIWLKKNFLPNYKLKFENMYGYEQINSGDMNDYVEYCEFNNSDPLVLTGDEISKAQDIEDYQFYITLRQNNILDN